ncbi:hypothetical protein NMY22_g15364 [Coprinellus aureogranulatus]|nr:hypothetical protein NMY22_g15364 [Coprinellus aureogranulatus]
MAGDSTRPSSSSPLPHTHEEKYSTRHCEVILELEETGLSNEQGSLSSLRLLCAHVGDLDASTMQYTWVGVAYLLTQTALQPLYGRVSDLVGRKAVLYASIVVFAVGSLLCGAAQSAEWLIAARALAGMGAGGIVSAVWVITSEIVEERNRAKWSQALSITWSCSAVAGPLLGGVFSGQQGAGHLSWRWGFYINLPICAVAVLIITLALRNVTLAKDPDASLSKFLSRFDFGGLILFVGGSGCIVVGFGLASDTGWSSPSTLSGIILGMTLLVAAGIHERFTKRDCLFPPTLFRKPTAVLILVISFLHYFAFTSGTFYLALYYQVDGVSSFICVAESATLDRLRMVQHRCRLA